jgi:toxin FitB
MSGGFLLDTMVPSELSRSRPDRHVNQWLTDTDDALMYLSVISLGEVCKGFTAHPEPRRRDLLRRWFEETLRPWFKGRILPVSKAIAERWGILEGESQLRGLTLSVPDGLIAATALEHGLTVVTRNVKDFAELNVGLLNPWDAP